MRSFFYQRVEDVKKRRPKGRVRRTAGPEKGLPNSLGPSTGPELEPEPILPPESPEIVYVNFGLQRNRSHIVLLDPAHELHRYAAPDFIWDMRTFNSLSELETYRDGAFVLNPSLITGGYFHACVHTAAELDSFPAAYLHTEDIDPSWDTGKLYPGSSTRYYLDLNIAACRAAVIAAAIASAETYSYNAVCFDNLYYNYGLVPSVNDVYSPSEWLAILLQFASEAYTACQSAGLKLVYNVASYASDFQGGIVSAFAAYAPYADGLLTEMAFHTSEYNRTRVTQELAGYDAVLALGKSVYLIPYAATSEERISNETRALVLVDSLVRAYPGKIYCTCDGAVHDNVFYAKEV